ncbi:LOW QUALITY PROTEIN: uncharacterized protein ACR2FA_007571 [Aphomia sociella]
MVYIEANCLGEKQRILNEQVQAAKLSNLKFDDAISEKETCDTDKLFKIDLASVQKNIDYIVKVLKCGDSLYVTRALKSFWIYEDEYSNIINPDNLHECIFPFMSLKMKKKFLTTLSINLRCKKRAASFYIYCMNSKLINIASKFLIITTNEFKLEMIQHKRTPFHNVCLDDGEKYTKHFIGDSFELATALLDSLEEHKRSDIINFLRYLYSKSSIEYLNMLEKYDIILTYKKNRYGLRISKSIMQNHKDRVLNNIPIYINRLNKNIIVKYSNENNAKLYLRTLLPEEASTFWTMRYCKTYKFILELIPMEKRFEFIKSLFVEKYNEEFEMTLNFYNLQYYKLMTPVQQNAWALHQVEHNKELLGASNDFIWYKFIDFKTSLKEIKKYVIVTPDSIRRIDMLNVLIESAKNQNDLKILLTYFYDRHVNEMKNNKERFVNKVIDNHNIFEFDDECWSAFEKILYSLNVYSANTINFRDNLFMLTTLIYHIIKKDMHDAFKKYLDENVEWYMVRGYLTLLYEKLSDNQREAVYQYLLQWYTEKVKSLARETDDEETRNKLIKYVTMVLNILNHHKKTKEECPDVVMQVVDLNWNEFKDFSIFREKEKSTNDILIHHLKKDASVVAKKLTEVENKLIHDYKELKINRFLRKIKVYFSNDLAKDYLNLFLNKLKSNETLSTKAVCIAMYGVFQLADENFLNDWMLKYMPTETKIDYSKIDSHLLDIQMTICRFACFSRPPIPLSNISMYIKGDYVQYCLPMFNYYAANLPLPLCLKFVESLIDAPVSIHKHGLRLAFSCFSIENLKRLITDLWNKTKNVSVRSIIYKALFDKIANGDEYEQSELFPILKSCTLDLNENDQGNIYDLMRSNKLSNELMREYIECTWYAVNKLSFDKTTNIQRKESVISNINTKINLMKADFVNSIIEKYINDILVQGAIKSKYPNNLDSFYHNIWSLTASYIIFYDDEYSDKNVEIARLIIKKCLEFWNMVDDDNTYAYREFCSYFVSFIIDKRYNEKRYEDAVPILEVIFKTLNESLPISEVYLILWDLQLAIVHKKVGQAGKVKFEAESTIDDKISVIKSTVFDFGNEVGNLIRNSVLNQTYFSCFSNDIKDKIACVVQNLKSSVDVRYEHDIDSTDLDVIVSMGLLQYNIIETYLLALNLLPNTSPRHWNEDFEKVINKIKAFNNLELKSCFYQKFINTDYKRRKYV